MGPIQYSQTRFEPEKFFLQKKNRDISAAGLDLIASFLPSPIYFIFPFKQRLFSVITKIVIKFSFHVKRKRKKSNHVNEGGGGV